MILWGIIVLAYSFILLSFRKVGYEDSVVFGCVVSSLVILIFQIALISKISGQIISPSTIFLGLYYIFQNGQLLLQAFNVGFNDFFVNSLSQYTLNVTIFSSISNVVAGYACMFVTSRQSRKTVKHYAVDSYRPEAVAKAAFYGFGLTGIIAIPLVLLKLSVALQGGYAAVRVYEETIPFWIKFLEYMFIPFALLYLIYNRARNVRVVSLLTLLWLLVTAFCGDRTTGLAGILVLAYIHIAKSGDRRIGIKQYLSFGMVIVALVFMVTIFFILRHQGGVNELQEGLQNPLVSFVSELGFSAFPLYVMMDIVPGSESYLNGTGYIASLVSGAIPSNLDPTGFIHYLVQYRNLPQDWIESYFSYGFGLGFSLNAEAYVNFGWFGLIPLFIVNLIIFHFLGTIRRINSDSSFALYQCCVLLFLWCTLPRRDSFYIWKALVYSIVLVKFYLYLIIPKRA